MKSIKTAGLILPLTAAVLLAACGGADKGKTPPATGPIWTGNTGTTAGAVTLSVYGLDGKPLIGASCTSTPVMGGTPASAGTIPAVTLVTGTSGGSADSTLPATAPAYTNLTVGQTYLVVCGTGTNEVSALFTGSTAAQNVMVNAATTVAANSVRDNLATLATKPMTIVLSNATAINDAVAKLFVNPVQGGVELANRINALGLTPAQQVTPSQAIQALVNDINVDQVVGNNVMSTWSETQNQAYRTAIAQLLAARNLPTGYTIPAPAFTNTANGVTGTGGSSF